ncbi:MAG: phosphotransferase family protein [Actinobacteria bacterium ATB1]|nr:phosphotransferase family protein [Actinobacteria bacterium ATB1]
MGPGHAHGLRRLSGGASRETWSYDWVPPSGVAHHLILCRDHASSPIALQRDAECTLLQTAGAQGVAVPAVEFTFADNSGLGSGFVMARVEGETIPRKILRDPEFAAARPLLASQCGEQLARIHAIDTADLPGLPRPPEDEHPVAALLRQYTAILDSMQEPHPAFELGLRWLWSNMPDPVEPRLVHGDFRNGNLIVGPNGIRAVLDWELAHLGDPMEDLGWLCVRAWRFGNDHLRVGGFGDLDELTAGYESAGGPPVESSAVRYWEVFGNLKWGVICLVQSRTHLNGIRRSVELAALGRRVAETEYDLLCLLG